MLDKFLSWFQGNKVTKEAIGSSQFYWVNSQDQRTHSITCIFYIHSDGSRSVKLLGNTHPSLYNPETHPWYASVVVPFIEHCGYGAQDNETIKDTIYKVCYPDSPPRNIYPKKPDKPKVENDGNVITFPNKN